MLYPRARWLLALCSACGFDHGVIASDGGGSDAETTSDAPDIDAPSVTPDAGDCYGTFVSICLAAPPPATLMITAPMSINTDTDCTQVVSQASGPQVCVVAARAIQISAALQASGTRPLVLLGTESISIAAGAFVDVGSYRDVSAQGSQVLGAGQASSALCGSPSTGGNDNSGSSPGAGGGAGGSFGGKGGNGARGKDNTGGSAGVAANATGTPTFVRGGCTGTSGGSGDGNTAGAGAAGGGAVHLIAGVSISNSGHIRASGMGGYGGAARSGGGGGGSGGFIGLDAPTVTNAGILNANGGGGGEGGGGLDPGATASSATTGTAAAPGGSGNINGGNGGDGSFGATSTGGAGSTGANGGGGGGGGAGVIRVFPAQTLAGTVSPPAS